MYTSFSEYVVKNYCLIMMMIIIIMHEYGNMTATHALRVIVSVLLTAFYSAKLVTM